jgi:tetratricopeptide (TPR) repeat protein
LPFWKTDRVADLRVGARLLEALELARGRRFDEAIECCDRALADVPNSYALRVTRAALLLLAGDYERGRAASVSLVENSRLKPQERVVTLNNIAWADVMLDRVELLEEASNYCLVVRRTHGKVAPFMGTHGLLLVSLGLLDQGISLLLKAYRTNYNSESRALNACSLALAFARKGNTDEARSWLEQGRKLHAECLLLPRATAAIQASQGAWEAPELIQRLAQAHSQAMAKGQPRQYKSLYLPFLLIFLVLIALKIIQQIP